jgi:hypothetical protein
MLLGRVIGLSGKSRGKAIPVQQKRFNIGQAQPGAERETARMSKVKEENLPTINLDAGGRHVYMMKRE